MEPTIATNATSGGLPRIMSKLKHRVGAYALLGGGALLVAGCAVPVPLQIASWALDGISYLTTEKSVSDHGLSLVAQSDCAIWRGVTEGELCRSWNDEEPTLIADAAKAETPAEVTPQRIAFNAVSAASDIPPLAVNLDDGLPNVDELANFETAAGVADTQSLPAVSVTRPLAAMTNMAAMQRPAPVRKPAVAASRSASQPNRIVLNIPPAPTMALKGDALKRVAPTQIAMPAPRTAPMRVLASTPTATPVTAMVSLPQLAPVFAPAPARVSPKIALAAKRSTYRGDEPAAGIYFVISSFRNYANARDYAGRHEALIPEVLASKLDGAPVYRVVVGPIRDGDERVQHRRLRQAGLADTWAIRVTPGDWLVARAVLHRKRPAASELAGITR